MTQTWSRGVIRTALPTLWRVEEAEEAEEVAAEQ